MLDPADYRLKFGPVEARRCEAVGEPGFGGIDSFSGSCQRVYLLADDADAPLYNIGAGGGAEPHVTRSTVACTCKLACLEWCQSAAVVARAVERQVEYFTRAAGPGGGYGAYTRAFGAPDTQELIQTPMTDDRCRAMARSMVSRTFPASPPSPPPSPQPPPPEPEPQPPAPPRLPPCGEISGVGSCEPEPPPAPPAPPAPARPPAPPSQPPPPPPPSPLTPDLTSGAARVLEECGVPTDRLESVSKASEASNSNATLLWRLNPYEHQSKRQPAFLRRRDASPSQRESLESLDEEVRKQMFLDQAERMLPPYHADRLAEIETCQQWEEYNREVWSERYSLTQSICDEIVESNAAQGLFGLSTAAIAGASIGGVVGIAGLAALGLLCCVKTVKEPGCLKTLSKITKGPKSEGGVALVPNRPVQSGLV